MDTPLQSGTAAFLAKPAQPNGLGLVVIPDIFGLRPLMTEIASRLAGENGFSVATFELFPGRESLDKADRWKVVPEIDQMTVVRDAELAADMTGCDQVAVLGFCMGGMYAFRCAALSNRFFAAVSFYGMIRLPDDARSATQTDPIDSLGDGHAPVLALMGGEDSWCPTDHVAELRRIQSVEVIEFPGAGHAFAHDPSRPEHTPEYAEIAWRNAIRFLEARSLPVK